MHVHCTVLYMHACAVANAITEINNNYRNRTIERQYTIDYIIVMHILMYSFEQIVFLKFGVKS